MADNVYQIGDVAPLTATFKDSAGNLANTTVVLEIRKPDGTVTTPTPSNPSTGVYHYDLTVTQAGLWWYAFVGSGAISAAEQNSLYVQARYTTAGPLSSEALVTLDEARRYVQGSPTDDRNDEKLISRINEVSDAVKWYTRREWLPVVTNVSRTFYYSGRGILSLTACDLRTVTSITAYTDLPTAYQQVLNPGSPTAIGDYRLGPTGGMPPGSTYRWLSFSNFWVRYLPQYFRGFEVTILGAWGIGVIPESVKEAVLIAVRDSIENPEAAAVRTLGPGSFQEPLDDLTPPEAAWRALPASSRALLAPFRDDPVVVAA